MAEQALAMMRLWEWEKPTQYGWADDPELPRTVPITYSLSDAMNQLAYEGHTDATKAILALICDGKLLANGWFDWRADQNGNFQYEGQGSIPLRRWQVLRECMEKWRKR